MLYTRSSYEYEPKLERFTIFDKVCSTGKQEFAVFFLHIKTQHLNLLAL